MSDLLSDLLGLDTEKLAEFNARVEVSAAMLEKSAKEIEEDASVNKVTKRAVADGLRLMGNGMQSLVASPNSPISAALFIGGTILLSTGLTLLHGDGNGDTECESS